MEFRILGPLEVSAERRSIRVGGARTRAVLAMLVLQANQVVSGERLANELWPGYESDRAAANLQVRLSELRKALRSVGESDRLITRAPGYLLRASTDELDALRFAELAADGAAALTAGDAASAVRRLDEALALCAGRRWPISRTPLGRGRR